MARVLTTLMILLAISLCASTPALAQTAQTEKRPYICVSGLPMWMDDEKEASLSEAQRATAYRDCKAKHKAEEAETDRSLREVDQADKQLQADLEQVRKVKCKTRTSYRENMLDDPECKDTPPDKDLLVSVHKLCEQWMGSGRPASCERLIPVILGKDYTPKRKKLIAKPKQ